MKIDPELRALVGERLHALELARHKVQRAMDIVHYHERVLRHLLDESEAQASLFIDRYAQLTRRWRKL